MKVLKIPSLLTLFVLILFISGFEVNCKALYPHMGNNSNFIYLFEVSLLNSMNRRSSFTLRKKNSELDQSKLSESSSTSKSTSKEFLRLGKIDYTYTQKDKKYMKVACNSLRVLVITMEISIDLFRDHHQELMTPIINRKCLPFLRSMSKECLKINNKLEVCKVINLHYRKVESAELNLNSYLSKLQVFVTQGVQLLSYFEHYHERCNGYIILETNSFEKKVDLAIEHSDRISKLPDFVNYINRINSIYCDPSVLVGMKKSLLLFIEKTSHTKKSGIKSTDLSNSDSSFS